MSDQFGELNTRYQDLKNEVSEMFGNDVLPISDLLELKGGASKIRGNPKEQKFESVVFILVDYMEQHPDRIDVEDDSVKYAISAYGAHMMVKGFRDFSEFYKNHKKNHPSNKLTEAMRYIKYIHESYFKDGGLNQEPRNKYIAKLLLPYFFKFKNIEVLEKAYQQLIDSQMPNFQDA